MMKQIMGETSEHLTRLKTKCIVNLHFDIYADIMVLLGNLYLQYKVIFNALPQSELT